MNTIKVPFELKEYKAEQGIFTGYAAAFNNVDYGNDRILQGAFANTIKEDGPAGANRIKVLVQHDVDKLIGKPILLQETNKGLYVEAKISDTALGRDTKTLMADGVYTEMSIGYDAIDYDYGTDGIRNLKELKLYEFGPVVWAMNDQATIESVKAYNFSDMTKEQETELSSLFKSYCSDNNLTNVDNVRFNGTKSEIIYNSDGKTEHLNFNRLKKEGVEGLHEYKIGQKALSFSDTMNLMQLDDMRYNAFDAIRSVLYQTFCDESDATKAVPKIAQDLQQFAAVMTDIYRKMYDARPADMDAGKAEELLLQVKTMIKPETANENSKLLLKEINELVQDPEQPEDTNDEEDINALNEIKAMLAEYSANAENKED